LVGLFIIFILFYLIASAESLREVCNDFFKIL
jgi:hypothetical protein